MNDIIASWGTRILNIKKYDKFFFKIKFTDGSIVNLIDYCHFTHKQQGVNQRGKDFEFFYNSILDHKSKEEFINNLYKKIGEGDVE